MFLYVFFVGLSVFRIVVGFLLGLFLLLFIINIVVVVIVIIIIQERDVAPW